jgi:hypothetical protein
MPGMPDKTLEERVGILEQGRDNGVKQQDERHKENMRRMDKIEERNFWILAMLAFTLLGSLANIGLTLLLRK